VTAGAGGAGADDLYQRLVVEHGRRPHNQGPLAGATHSARGDNPFCGDRVTVALILENDQIADVRFDGAGCAISTAAASMMTVALRGRTRAEAETLCRDFEALLVGTGGGGPAAAAGDKLASAPGSLGDLAAFAGVRRFPVRVKCARLPWQTLMAALAGGGATVSTE
jgi:nitrogen fixation NifU-like protein